MSRNQNYRYGKRYRNDEISIWQKLLKIIVTPVYLLCAVALLLAYSSAYIDPSINRLPALFGLYIWLLLAIDIILLIIALWRQSKLMWISIIALVPVITFMPRLFKINLSKYIFADSRGLCIATYNVFRFTDITNHMDSTVVTPSICQALTDCNTDIICFEEFATTDTTAAKKIFSQYPYSYLYLPHKRNGVMAGNAIFSKYRLTNKGVLKLNDYKFAIFADISLDTASISKARVFVAHMQSTNISLTKLTAKLYNKSLQQADVVGTHQRLGNAFENRSKQIHDLLNLVKQSEYPVILCGDFNDTPMSYTYQQIKRQGLKDGFAKAGRNTGGTYKMLYPLLRIDYLFHSKEFKTISSEVLKIKFSDHYPLITRLKPRR